VIAHVPALNTVKLLFVFKPIHWFPQLLENTHFKSNKFKQSKLIPIKSAKVKLFISCFFGGRIPLNLVSVELSSGAVKNRTVIQTKVVVVVTKIQKYVLPPASNIN